jgi:uncharacterized membrane protein HdeD (DUF308 family)
MKVRKIHMHDTHAREMFWVSLEIGVILVLVGLIFFTGLLLPSFQTYFAIFGAILIICGLISIFEGVIRLFLSKYIDF